MKEKTEYRSWWSSRREVRKIKSVDEIKEIANEIYQLCVDKNLTYADYRSLLVQLQIIRNSIDRINSDIAENKKLVIF